MSSRTHHHPLTNLHPPRLPFKSKNPTQKYQQILTNMSPKVCFQIRTQFVKHLGLPLHLFVNLETVWNLCRWFWAILSKANIDWAGEFIISVFLSFLAHFPCLLDMYIGGCFGQIWLLMLSPNTGSGFDATCNWLRGQYGICSTVDFYSCG